MIRNLFALLAVAGLATSASAGAIATLNVLTDTTYNVTLEASQGDNFGIAAYAVTVAGVATLDHMSPHTAFAQNAAFAGGTAGFEALRTADGVLAMTGSQTLIPAPTPHVIKGFGQTAGSFAALGLNVLAPAESPVWEAPLVIATGTWADSGEALPSLTLASISLFNSQTSNSTTTGQAEMRVVDQRVPEIPEPSTIALAGLALVGLVGYARRK